MNRARYQAVNPVVEFRLIVLHESQRLRLHQRMWRCPVCDALRQLDACALRGRCHELICVISRNLLLVLIVVFGEVGQLGEESLRTAHVMPLSRRGRTS